MQITTFLTCTTVATLNLRFKMLGSDARVVEESWYESIVANLRDDTINTRVQA